MRCLRRALAMLICRGDVILGPAMKQQKVCRLEYNFIISFLGQPPEMTAHVRHTKSAVQRDIVMACQNSSILANMHLACLA